METVSHIPPPSSSSSSSNEIPSYIAQIQCNSLTSSESTSKPFTYNDMERVQDFDHVTPPPKTTKLRILLNNKFQECDFTLKGGYLFYMNSKGSSKRGSSTISVVTTATDDNEGGTLSSSLLQQSVPCVPLYQCMIEYPPGGRRVFRDHVNLEGVAKGYEFAIKAKCDGTPDTILAFVVADKLSRREEWINGIKHRSDIRRETRLQIITSGSDGKSKEKQTDDSEYGVKASDFRTSKFHQRMALTQTIMGNAQPDKELLQSALRDFGKSSYNEMKWVNSFFRNHIEYESPVMGRTLDSYLREVRQGLRGMVLEQYEYFVEASKEMTVMGKEITKLRDAWEEQNQTINTMKEIDFHGAFIGILDSAENQDAASYSDDSSTGGGAGGAGKKVFTVSMLIGEESSDDDSSMDSSVSEKQQRYNAPKKKSLTASTLKQQQQQLKEQASAHPDIQEEMQLPSYIFEAIEDISNLSVQCRYTQASNLCLKTKDELDTLLSSNQQPPSVTRNTSNTSNKSTTPVPILSEKQTTTLLQIQEDLEILEKKMCQHLVEKLRRKNEALRQTLKRDRSSAAHTLEWMLLPLVSPTCMDDDNNDLHLLVKHGRTQEAATAYAARRTLLINEYLHERPISGSGVMDLIIYASQLSQSFFSCLSTSVEGFLDLFLGDASNHNDDDNDDDDSADGDKDDGDMFLGRPSFPIAGVQQPPTQPHLETNTILSNEIMTKIPAGALASIVFWCDAELSKFASFFCTKVLGILSLQDSGGSMKEEGTASLERRNSGGSVKSDRQLSIEVAAKCLDQVFLLASENLDSIGLPLSCKLADYIYRKLKGCHVDIAHKLNARWNHVIYSWFYSENGGMLDERPSVVTRNVSISSGVTFAEG